MSAQAAVPKSNRALASGQMPVEKWPMGGYTLLEMCVVVGIAATLTSMAVQGLDRSMGARIVESAAMEFALDVQYAKSQALALNRNIAVAFTNTGPRSAACYTLYVGATGSCHCQAEGPAQCTGDSASIKSVIIPLGHGVSATANVRTMLVEHSRGLVTPAGSLTFTSRDGIGLRDIVSITGRVRTCSLGAPSPGYPVC